MPTKARRIASLLTKAKSAPPNTVQFGDSDDTRLFVPGIGLDTNLAQTGQSLVWNNTSKELGFGNPLPGIVSIYDSINQLPLTGDISLGQKAFVNDTNKLYLYEGSGWYNIAIINQSPSFITGPSLSYSLSTDGTPTVITLAAQDSEGVPLSWSYETSGLLNEAVITQGSGDSSNVFTITPSTSDSDEGSFTITFKVTDGINITSESSTIVLAFFKQLIFSWPENQYDTFSTATDVVYDQTTQTYYTLGYAENWANTGNGTYPILMTKHNSEGIWQAGYRYHNTSGSYIDGGNSGVLIDGSNHGDSSHLYAAINGIHVYSSQIRRAHFYLKIQKSNLQCVDLSCIYALSPNGNHGSWYDKDETNGTYLTTWTDSLTAVLKLSPTSMTGPSLKKSYVTNYYTGASAPFNIHENAFTRLGVLPNNEYVIFGDGWDLLDTTNYYRRGGPLIAVCSSNGSVVSSRFVNPTDTSTRWDYTRPRQGGSTNVATLNNIHYVLYERIFGTGSITPSITKYHIIQFSRDMSTVWDYSKTIQSTDSDFVAQDVFSDGTNLYVIGYGNRKSWIVKVSPETDGSSWTVGDVLRIRTSGTIQPLQIKKIKFYGNDMVLSCSMGYNGTSDLNGGVITLSSDFTTYSTTEVAQSGDYSSVYIQKDENTTFSIQNSTYGSSSGNLTISVGTPSTEEYDNIITTSSYPTSFGSSSTYFNVNTSTTSLDKDGTLLTL